MSRMKNFVPLALRSAALLVSFIALAALMACLPDRVGWSPDGRTIYFIRTHDDGLYSRDVATKEEKKIYAHPDHPVVFVFAAGGKAVFFAMERPGPNPDQPIRDLHLARDGKVIENVVKEFSPEAGMASSADGKIAYAGRAIPAGEEFVRIDLSVDPPATKVVYQHEKGFGYPSASADGARVLLSFETGIAILDAAAGTTTPIIKTVHEKAPPLYGVWAMNDNAIVYLETYVKKDKPDEGSSFGRLMIHSMDDQSTRKLGGGVPILRRPMISPDGRTAYVTQALNATESDEIEMADVPLSRIQVVAYDLASGERRVLTEEKNGAFWPAPDPTGKRIAYFTARPGTRGDNPDELILKYCELGEPGDARATLNCETPQAK